MFWEFGLVTSPIDQLLDNQVKKTKNYKKNKETLSLEACLDEADILQEVKSRNTRLINL